MIAPACCASELWNVQRLSRVAIQIIETRKLCPRICQVSPCSGSLGRSRASWVSQSLLYRAYSAASTTWLCGVYTVFSHLIASAPWLKAERKTRKHQACTSVVGVLGFPSPSGRWNILSGNPLILVRVERCSPPSITSAAVSGSILHFTSKF